jgi:hypothetical protein
MSEITFNPAKRRLCPDGACVGVVGDDGRCRVCGLAGDGSGHRSISSPSTPGDGYSDGAGADAHADAHGNADAGTVGAPATGADREGELGFRPDRRLCDDGSCVGVIGNSGVCSVCGRPAGS